MYNSILIANRGEIALRILHTLKAIGVESVILSSPIDRDTLPVRLADKVIELPGNLPHESYLNFEYFLPLAKEMGAEAVHPGYGFLSENIEFRMAVSKQKLDFVGPTEENMRILGEKVPAREAARKSGTPLLPGSYEPREIDELFEIAKNIGFPVLIKASAGGGGRGIRLVEKEEDFMPMAELAAQEAQGAFGNPEIFVEKYLRFAKHIEVQLLGTETGVLHFGERDCTIQRKNQKLIEEAPAPSITREKASEIHESAVALGNTVKYMNAGTAEFLLDEEGNHYFMEVNTRIQVEHPVTEFITGEDLIFRQLQVASGEDLELDQKDIGFKGHAIEARVYAENPYNQFMPSPGKIHRLRHPMGPGIRVDSHAEPNSLIPNFYDSMIGKLISFGATREMARKKLVNAINQYRITGIHTTLSYIRQILETDEFKTFNYHTKFLETNPKSLSIPSEIIKAASGAAVLMLQQQRPQNMNTDVSQTVSGDQFWKRSYFSAVRWA
ncbi:MAG: ATP-grasp domain-containing protein [Methanobacteriota archaeon]|nr:MAG: ATP-grasp domain-containing protein [Euryarchaeota archaeon]